MEAAIDGRTCSRRRRDTWEGGRCVRGLPAWSGRVRARRSPASRSGGRNLTTPSRRVPPSPMRKTRFASGEKSRRRAEAPSSACSPRNCAPPGRNWRDLLHSKRERSRPKASAAFDSTPFSSGRSQTSRALANCGSISAPAHKPRPRTSFSAGLWRAAKQCNICSPNCLQELLDDGRRERREPILREELRAAAGRSRARRRRRLRRRADGGIASRACCVP